MICKMTRDNLWLRILFHQESTLHCPMECFVIHLNVEIRCRCSIVTRPDLSAIILYVNQIMFIALMVLASIIKHILQGRNTLLPRISFLMFRQTNMWSLEEKSHPLPTSADSSIHMILIVETFIITMKEWDLAHTSLMMAGDFLLPFLVQDILTNPKHPMHLFLMMALHRSQLDYRIKSGIFIPRGCITETLCLLDLLLNVQFQWQIELRAFGGQDEIVIRVLGLEGSIFYLLFCGLFKRVSESTWFYIDFSPWISSGRGFTTDDWGVTYWMGAVYMYPVNFSANAESRWQPSRRRGRASCNLTLGCHVSIPNFSFIVGIIYLVKGRKRNSVKKFTRAIG